MSVVASSTGINEIAHLPVKLHQVEVVTHLLQPLDTSLTVTASGIAVHVRKSDTCVAVCDVTIPRRTLRELLAHCNNLLALEDTAEMPALKLAGV
jgi:hypothetical protein